MEEQTFYNNGQFTENELNLIGWGLNDLLQKINRASKKPAKGITFAKTFTKKAWKLPDIQQIENLIEKIQEGS